MKKRIVSVFLSMVFIFSSTFLFATDCDAGGVGATSCSIAVHTEAASVAITSTFSVSCGEGRYACCKGGIGQGFAKCIENPKPLSFSPPKTGTGTLPKHK